MPAQKYKTVTAYINSFELTTQAKLTQLRNLILKAAPNATEGIGYNMPAYKQNGVLVYFAGYKNHIGFYPTPNVIVAFEKELLTYTFSKGAIQFPIHGKLPVTLITKMVKFKLKENLTKTSK